MILADTSVLVDHLRRGNDTLVQALEADVVVCHPFVVGELELPALHGDSNQRSSAGVLYQY